MKTEMTSETIRANIDNPGILEKLYHENKKAFKSIFDTIYPEIENTGTAGFWKARLDYESNPVILKSFLWTEAMVVLFICAITAFLIKIPSIFSTGYPDEVFYMKNGVLIVSFGLSLFTVYIRKLYEPVKLIITSLLFLIPAFYINLLPPYTSGDAVNLSHIHMFLLMWYAYGIVFTGFDLKDPSKRIEFIRHNGDLMVIFALIAISGGLLTAITIGLFDSIGINIEKIYAEYIIISGVAIAPVVAAYITEKIPSLVSKTVPVLAGIFSPLVLLTLVVFLVSMLVTGKDPYNDRDFLIIFNAMLLGVMAIIIFSVSESSAIKFRNINAIVLSALSVVTIIIDLIALSAIFYRLGEFGLTPNRLAVLVSNILVLANLIIIMTDLFRIVFKGREFSSVELSVSRFLPVYLLWIIIVVFCFPLLFGVH